MGAHVRVFEIADATSVSSLISTTLRISNVRDYPGDFLSKVEASLTPPSLRELAKDRVILVAVEENAIVGTGRLWPLQANPRRALGVSRTSWKAYCLGYVVAT